MVIVKKHVPDKSNIGYVRKFETDFNGTIEENYNNCVYSYKFYKTKEEDDKGFFAQMEVNIVLAE